MRKIEIRTCLDVGFEVLIAFMKDLRTITKLP